MYVFHESKKSDFQIESHFSKIKNLKKIVTEEPEHRKEKGWCIWYIVKSLSCQIFDL